LGFEVGRTYNRRADIHARFGGQQQGGIVTPTFKAGGEVQRKGRTPYHEAIR
jgi:hypothetical protein